MGYIDIKNKKGTSGRVLPSGYSSWLNYWEKKKGKKATVCEALSCGRSAEVGGHVIKSGQGGKEYILPICSSHNNMSESVVYEAWENDLILANQ